MALARKYWSRIDSKLWLSRLRDTRTGAATSESDVITAEVIAVRDTGFNRDVTFRNTIGDSYIPSLGKINPATIEIEFVFSDLDYGKAVMTNFTQTLNANRLSNTIVPYKIRLEYAAIDDTGVQKEAYRKVYYNCYGVSLTQDDSENCLKGTLSFTLSPFNEVGLPNYREMLCTATDSYSALSSAEYSSGAVTEWDVQMGYSAKV